MKWPRLLIAALSLASLTSAAEPPPSSPYQRRALADLADAELLKRMGPGRSAQEFERASILRDHVPDGFWALAPKEAALALVEAHRSEDNRAWYALSFEERRGETMPESGSVALTYASSRCYNAIDEFYFLRFDPAGSYLAYARTVAGGVVFYNVVHDQPAFDLRLCPLSYADARQVAETLWWLERVHTRLVDPRRTRLGGLMSTADGSGTAALRTGDGTVVWERSGTRWSDAISERWKNGFSTEVFVNFASHVMTGVLPERLGSAWTQAAPRDRRLAMFRGAKAPAYMGEELRRFEALTGRFLADFSPRQEKVSYAIVAAAAEAAGSLRFESAKPALERILAALPDPEESRTFADVERDLAELRKKTATDQGERARNSEARRKLEAERAELKRELGADGPRRLRGEVALALRKLAVADDVTALYAWALRQEAGSQWALQRLRRVDPPRYVQALEVWMKTAKPGWARQYFEEIARVDPARAAEISRGLPAAEAGALTVSAYSVLDAAKQMTDEAQRVKALIGIVTNPKSGWEERGKAIELLVPADDPLRHPQAEVDRALLRTLDADQADEIINFTTGASCQALALRGRVETFERMTALLRNERLDGEVWLRVLGAAALLAEADSERLKPRLREIVSAELDATNKRVAEILWVVWAADLRELLPKVERLATSGPEDYEDKRAAMSGGNVSPVTERFHLARKLADTWNADDAVTRIRLLTALAFETAYFVCEEPDTLRVRRLKASLREAAVGLTAAQRERLEQFFEAAITRPGASEDDAVNDSRRKVVKLVRTIIAPGAGS